jgi:DNA polymerase III sliding clamp (beta) subunit (PCNA family)
MDGFDFPEIPVGGSIYRMTESDLSYIIAHVEDFTSNDDTFTSLQGVLFSQRENTLHVVATDRTKLGMVEFPAECEIPRSSIVPIGFLTSIKHLLGSSDSNVTLGFAEDRVYLKNENFVAFSSLIDQVFPNYLPVINTAESLGISLPVKALRDSLLRMSCLADNHKPLFELLFDNNTLTLTSQNPNSSGKEVLTLSKNKQTVNHPPFSLVLSGMSLINILDFYSSDCVAFLNTNKKPVVFKSSEHPSLTYVQTPFFK